MKKIVIIVLFGAFLASCSQYTCPTYTKKEPVKKNAEQKI